MEMKSFNTKNLDIFTEEMFSWKGPMAELA